MKSLILPRIEAHPEQSYREIGQALGLSPQVVQWWAAKSGVLRRRRGSTPLNGKEYIIRAVQLLPEVTYDRIAEIFNTSTTTVASLVSEADLNRPRGGKKRSFLPKEDILNALHLAFMKMSTKEGVAKVAQDFGIHCMTVYKIARESNIYSVIPVNRKPTKKGQAIIDLLRNSPHLSYGQVAEKAGSHVITVSYWAKKYNIPHKPVRKAAANS